MSKRKASKPKTGTRRRSAGRSVAKRKSTALAKKAKYVPTKADQAATQDFLARRVKKTELARCTLDEGRVLGWNHDDSLYAWVRLANVLGTNDINFAEGFHLQIADSLGNEITAAKVDRTMAIVRGIAPRDPTESLLAGQMAIVHNATVQAAAHLASAETLPQAEAASNSLNKLGRTFAAQMDTLKRYRSAGEQTVRVEHVTVQNGGQAIVGVVHPGGGGYGKNASQPLEPSVQASERTALPCDVQTNAKALPSPGIEGPACLSVPRGQGRSASGNGKRQLAKRIAH